jgi:hypothetical protein
MNTAMKTTPSFPFYGLATCPYFTKMFSHALKTVEDTECSAKISCPTVLWSRILIHPDPNNMLKQTRTKLIVKIITCPFRANFAL